MCTRSTPRSSRSFAATGTGSWKPTRLLALAMTPDASSTSPGEPSPTPASSRVSTPACWAASRTAAASAATTPSAPPPVGVGCRVAARTCCSSSATIAWIFVPPRSMPARKTGMGRKVYPISSAPRSTFPRPMLVRELTDGAEVDLVLLVREAELRSRRDGAKYLRMTLCDKTGSLTAIVWDGVDDCAPHARCGEPVRVAGRFAQHPRYGAQVTVRALAPPAPGTFVLEDLLDGPPQAVGEMEAALRELLSTVQNPYLRALLDRVFGERSELWARFREAPAAKHYHQAYRHGLLEHALSVGQAAHLLSGTFPGLDHDLAVTGALLHDIGKLDAYSSGPSIDLTDAGRLQGEIPLGYYRVRRLCEEIDGFPPALAEHVCHVILSHHGTLEHGSPVVPCTREATLVHFLDNLGGRLGSLPPPRKEPPRGRGWSPVHPG